MKRIPTRTLLAAATIYQHAARYGEGYRPSEKARFGAIRETPDGPWLLIHLRSGFRVNSLLPPRKLGASDLLKVAAAFEAAAHLDWAPFDNLPEIHEGQPKQDGFAEADRAAAQRMVPDLRALAEAAVAR